MSTIRDVARLAGVSVATVSRVLNRSPKTSQDARDRVGRAMAELAYTPSSAAKELVSRSSKVMGVLVGDIADPFFGALAKGVGTVAGEAGMQLLVSNGGHRAEREREAIELLIGRRCDALVIHAKALPDAELLACARRVPGLVLINRAVAGIDDRCVTLDNYQGALTATRHLLANGRRRLACLSSNHEVDDSRARLLGYRDALSQEGVAFDAALIELASPDEAGGEAAMLALLARGARFDAVVAYNDAMAAGAMAVLADNGIAVPAAVSVIGFDDLLHARYLYPKLTTMRYPIEQMATHAARLALQRAAGSEGPLSGGRYQPLLVQRNSVMPLQPNSPR